MGCFVVLWCGPKRGFENRHRVGAAVVVLPALVRCFGEVLRSRAPRDAERRTGCAHASALAIAARSSASVISAWTFPIIFAAAISNSSASFLSSSFLSSSVR